MGQRKTFFWGFKKALPILLKQLTLLKLLKVLLTLKSFKSFNALIFCEKASLNPRKGTLPPAQDCLQAYNYLGLQNAFSPDITAFNASRVFGSFEKF